jgi:hypothetical protein
VVSDVIASTFSRSKVAVTARQRQAIELRARGVPMDQIAEIMGNIRRDTLTQLINRALSAQAMELREEGAWERAYILQTTRLDLLMATWMPKALAGDDKAADKVDKWLTHYERLQGLAAPQRLEAEVTVDDRTDARAEVIAGVLARLDDVKKRQQIIDGSAVDAEVEEA